MKQKPAAEKLMTQAEYARHRGKSRPYICKLAKSGALILRGQKVVVALSDAVLDDRAAVAQVKPNGSGGGSGATDAGESLSGASSYSEARTSREFYHARLKRLEFEQKAGELIPAAVVARKWGGIAQTVKAKLESLPSKLSPQLAALTDPRQIRDMLTRELAGVLKAIAEEVRYGNAK